MSIKPILFNTEMVKAILNEQKSVTRRVIKQYVPEDAKFGYTAFTPEGYISARGTYADGWGEKFYRLPYRPGDILWVRETFCPWYLPNGELTYRYKATEPNGNKAPTGPDYEDEWEVRPWCPSIHMPKEAARIFLQVTNVRGERLQDIGRLGIFREGIDRSLDDKPVRLVFNAFHTLWDSTIKPADLPRYGWAANPPVLVNEFERCEKPEGWLGT